MADKPMISVEMRRYALRLRDCFRRPRCRLCRFDISKWNAFLLSVELRVCDRDHGVIGNVIEILYRPLQEGRSDKGSDSDNIVHLVWMPRIGSMSSLCQRMDIMFS